MVLGWVAPLAAQIHTLDLGGVWQLSSPSQTNRLVAQVPGHVHLDLLRAGRIPDPFYRDNAAQIEWVYQTSWTYERTFDVPASLLAHQVVLLHCEGLDTVADLELNGVPLASTDNMYRTWEFDVKNRLHAGANQLRITFSPIRDYIRAFEARAPKVPNATGIDISNIRKSSYMNSWDFCARFLPCGIYKPISLIAYDQARFADVRINQDLTDLQQARLGVEVYTERTGAAPLVAEAEVAFNGRVLSRQTAAFTATNVTVPLSISAPQLWWPAGMGEHPLYTVTVRLRDQAGQLCDTAVRRIGLRTIELRPKTAERPLRLAVNGREIYAKGADWIPGDVFPTRITAEKIRSYIADAVAVNMNMIRIWGGGYYPEDVFYDACDEQGILLWSEFCFACAPYPGNNPEFIANIQPEIRDQVRRLRHHAAIAVWCGNNEVEGLITGYKLITREQYDHLFHEIIGTEVKALYPAANYVGGSPEAGDEHNWWVWHVGADFEHYRQSHGWMTEFGFQSFPEPATVYSYTRPDERDSVLNPVNVFHQKNGNGKGNPMILDKMNAYFRPAKNFDSTLWLSQILQGMGMNTGIEHWRTDWPHSSGSLVWQYNDCWPGPTWASVDYYGRWKAAQYGYRHAFAPVMISGLYDEKAKTVQLKVASDLTTATPAQITWQVTDLQGQTLTQGQGSLTLPGVTAATNGPVVDAGPWLATTGAEHALLWLHITAGTNGDENVVFLTRPKNLELLDPQIETTVKPAGNGFDVTVQAHHPALWVWLECADPDARYSDNFRHLRADQPLTIHVIPSPGAPKAVAASFKAHSLFDTYGHP